MLVRVDDVDGRGNPYIHVTHSENLPENAQAVWEIAERHNAIGMKPDPDSRSGTGFIAVCRIRFGDGLNIEELALPELQVRLDQEQSKAASEVAAAQEERARQKLEYARRAQDTHDLKLAIQRLEEGGTVRVRRS